MYICVNLVYKATCKPVTVTNFAGQNIALEMIAINDKIVILLTDRMVMA